MPDDPKTATPRPVIRLTPTGEPVPETLAEAPRFRAYRCENIDTGATRVLWRTDDRYSIGCFADSGNIDKWGPADNFRPLEDLGPAPRIEIGEAAEQEEEEEEVVRTDWLAGLRFRCCECGHESQEAQDRCPRCDSGAAGNQHFTPAEQSGGEDKTAELAHKVSRLFMFVYQAADNDANPIDLRVGAWNTLDELGEQTPDYPSDLDRSPAPAEQSPPQEGEGMDPRRLIQHHRAAGHLSDDPWHEQAAKLVERLADRARLAEGERDEAQARIDHMEAEIDRVGQEADSRAGEMAQEIERLEGERDKILCQRKALSEKLDLAKGELEGWREAAEQLADKANRAEDAGVLPASPTPEQVDAAVGAYYGDCEVSTEAANKARKQARWWLNAWRSVAGSGGEGLTCNRCGTSHVGSEWSPGDRCGANNEGSRCGGTLQRAPRPTDGGEGRETDHKGRPMTYWGGKPADQPPAPPEQGMVVDPESAIRWLENYARTTKEDYCKPSNFVKGIANLVQRLADRVRLAEGEKHPDRAWGDEIEEAVEALRADVNEHDNTLGRHDRALQEIDEQVGDLIARGRPPNPSLGDVLPERLSPAQAEYVHSQHCLLETELSDVYAAIRRTLIESEGA